MINMSRDHMLKVWTAQDFEHESFNVLYELGFFANCFYANVEHCHI